MRGTVAKKFRQIARESSEPTQRHLLPRKWGRDLTGQVVVFRGQVVCSGVRRAYQQAKKSYKSKLTS